MPRVTPTLPKRRGKIDPVKAYQMRVVNRLTFQQIADHMDVTKTAVIQRLKQFSNLIHNAEDKAKYEAIRTHALTTLEEQLIASLADPDKHSKASLNNLAYTFDKIHQARRLEEDKSVANSSSVLHVLIDQQHSQLFSKPKHLTPHVQDTEPAETDLEADTSTTTA